MARRNPEYCFFSSAFVQKQTVITLKSQISLNTERSEENADYENSMQI